jgi:hypothetical protein
MKKKQKRIAKRRAPRNPAVDHGTLTVTLPLTHLVRMAESFGAHLKKPGAAEQARDVLTSMIEERNAKARKKKTKTKRDSSLN